MSEIFTVGVKDFIRGIIVATVSGVIMYIYGAVNSGTLSIDWHQVGIVALASGLGYIVKNYLTTADGRFAGIL